MFVKWLTVKSDAYGMWLKEQFVLYIGHRGLMLCISRLPIQSVLLGQSQKAITLVYDEMWLASQQSNMTMFTRNSLFKFHILVKAPF